MAVEAQGIEWEIHKSSRDRNSDRGDPNTENRRKVLLENWR